MVGGGLIATAFSDGVRRVAAAPALAVGVFAMTLVLALPLTFTMRGLIEAHLGRSLAAGSAADDVNPDWWQEFTAQASGLGTTFTPSVIGFAATLDTVSSVADGTPPVMAIRGAIGAYLLGWLILSGGILDRYARQRPTRVPGFFAACGVFFFRFLRLGIVAGIVYGFLFTYVHQWMFDRWYTWATRDVAVERTALLWRFGIYGLFAAFVAAANVVFDYAKIRAVVEDRRSMLGALSASLGFILRHPRRVLGLYALNTVAFLVVAATWAVASPRAGGMGLSMWAGLLAGQIYVLARLLLKLQFLASQAALFQRSLAHASYVAAPVPVWPESPMAELISQVPGPASSPHPRER